MPTINLKALDTLHMPRQHCWELITLKHHTNYTQTCRERCGRTFSNSLQSLSQRMIWVAKEAKYTINTNDTNRIFQKKWLLLSIQIKDFGLEISAEA